MRLSTIACLQIIVDNTAVSHVFPIVIGDGPNPSSTSQKQGKVRKPKKRPAEVTEPTISLFKSQALETGKRKGKAQQDEDYRDEKWKGLQAPLDVEHMPKLRQSKPAPAKEGALESQVYDDVDPLDLTSPPVVWVEVFSKPFQRWITVDPIRARVSVTGNRQMEPAPSDRANKLVYVVAFEEDGYARDVTARYTKPLYSRVSRMRPPATKKGGEWWESVVRATHEPAGRAAARSADRAGPRPS